MLTDHASTLGRTFTRHPWRLLPVLLLLAGVSSGCGSQLGSAAIVGGVSIESDDIADQNAELSALGAAPQATDLLGIQTLIDNNRALLTGAVHHEIIRSLVDAGVVPAPSADQIATYVQGNESTHQLEAQLSATTATLPDRIYDALVLQNAATAAAGVGVSLSVPSIAFDYVQYSDLAAGTAALEQYTADPTAMDALSPTVRQSGELTLLDLPGGATTGIFSADVGGIVLFPVAAGYVMLRITDRTDASVPLTTDLLASVSADAGALGVNMIGAMVLAQKGAIIPNVQVNPRFGRWDSRLLQVVPA